jgi:hypothetical protein
VETTLSLSSGILNHIRIKKQLCITCCKRTNILNLGYQIYIDFVCSYSCTPSFLSDIFHIGKCGVSSTTLYVTPHENVTFHCNYNAKETSRLIWFYGDAANQVAIVYNLFVSPPVKFPNQVKPPYSVSDYIYNTMDSSLTIHGSKLNFSACYECETINQEAVKQYYQSYILELAGKYN